MVQDPRKVALPDIRRLPVSVRGQGVVFVPDDHSCRGWLHLVQRE